MATAYQLMIGQRGKVLRLQTGIDLTDTTARIVRLRRDEEEPVEITAVPYDPASPGDLLLTTAAGHFDVEGTYAVEVEVQKAGGIVLKCDEQITVEAVTLGEPDDE